MNLISQTFMEWVDFILELAGAQHSAHWYIYWPRWPEQATPKIDG